MATAHPFARPHSNVRGAQLTVFYAGIVNVYDEVPFDKAQAIMVLAGRARTQASSIDTNAPSESCATELDVNKPMCTAVSPSPPLTTKPESIPNLNVLPIAKKISKRVELPQARKASIARFLERRKDRLRASPYTSTTPSNRASPSTS